MRIMLILEYYDEYLRAFYERRAGLAARPFAVQLDALLDDGFWWIPALGRRLGEAGHEVFFSCPTVEPLQRKWAAEQGLAFDPRDYAFRVPLAQARAFKPDLVWIGSMFQYYDAFLREIKEVCPRVLAWIATTTPRGLDLSCVDAVVSSHENLAAEMRARGKPCAVLRPAFEPRVLGTLGAPERDIPFSFIGSYSWRHQARLRVLDRLVRQTPLRLWGKGTLVHPGVLGWHYAIKHFLPWLHRTRLEERFRGPAWGLEMYAILCRSQLTLNAHGDVAAGMAGNMRMFEATGCGALLLTEDAPNLAAIFEPGKEVVTYASAEEAALKTRTYLSARSERERIAAAGQARTLKDHTTEVRAREFSRIVSQFFG